MTTSILNDALLLRNEDPTRLQEYLHSVNLTIFDPIFHTSANLKEAQQTVLYILCAFSEDSPLLILRQDSAAEKEGICNYLDIPDFLAGPLMEITKQEVRRAITKYLDQFGSPLFKALKLLEIQLEDLNLAITNREFIIQKEGEDKMIDLYDFKEFSKAVTQYELLCKRKDALEKELKSTIVHKELLEMKEYKFKHVDKKISKSAKGGISMENSNLIRLGNGSNG